MFYLPWACHSSRLQPHLARKVAGIIPSESIYGQWTNWISPLSCYASSQFLHDGVQIHILGYLSFPFQSQHMYFEDRWVSYSKLTSDMNVTQTSHFPLRKPCLSLNVLPCDVLLTCPGSITSLKILLYSGLGPFSPHKKKKKSIHCNCINHRKVSWQRIVVIQCPLDYGHGTLPLYPQSQDMHFGYDLRHCCRYCSYWKAGSLSSPENFKSFRLSIS